MTLFTLDALHAARDLVHRHMPPTPVYAWPLLRDRVGTEIWVKHENHTPCGAFKMRGGLVYLDELVRTQPDCPGIITATRGNHGQSIPYAARAHGIPVKVYVPEGNSVEKNSAMRAWGAEVITFGSDFEESRLEAVRVGEAEGLHIIGLFHEPLVRGVATYAMELFTAVPDLDVVYVPIGMGSGICGLITVRDLLGLKTEIVGVVSTGAEAYALYGAAVTKIIYGLGGKSVYAGQVTGLMLGEVEEMWDMVALVEYPNSKAFQDMVASPEYQAIHVHRDAGLAGQLNIRTKPGAL